MKNKTRTILIGAFICLTGCFSFVENSFAQSITSASPYVINSVSVPWVDTTYPTRATPNLDESITDVNYRIQTLPYDQDKSAAWYVVYPKAWVTIPLVRPDDGDIKKIQVGELFNHYKYLEDGVLHYVWYSPDQWIWNMVLAVHSSYLKNDPWRYKTAGQVAPLSTVGDKVFVYLADTTWKYTLYIYTIKRSEEIPETAVDILKQDVTEKSLTLFTCYPIGTTDARRVNQAVLTETLSEEQFQSWTKSHQSAPTTNQNASFTTQSAKKTTAPSLLTSPATTKTKKITKSQKIKPTFKERVIYRPVVYKTAMSLIKKVWFKRTNLQKVIDLIETKITWFENALPKDPNAKNKIVLFMLTKEIIEGFMR